MACRLLKTGKVSQRYGGSAAFSTSRLQRNEKLHSLNQLTEEEQLLKEAVSKFARDTVASKVHAMDEKEEMEPSIIKALFDQGLMGIESDAEFNGAQSSFTSSIIAIEELAKVDPSVSIMCDVQNTLVNNMVKKYGTHEQKAKYQTMLATDTVGCFCLSEPVSGSDAFALQTRAEKRDDYYVINGGKMWITNAKEAGIFLVFANVDPSKGYKGITCFIVEKDFGVQIAKKESKVSVT